MILPLIISVNKNIANKKYHKIKSWDKLQTYYIRIESYYIIMIIIFVHYIIEKIKSA